MSRLLPVILPALVLVGCPPATPFDTADTLPAGSTEFVQISAGEYHNCGLTPDQTVVCWGSDASDQCDAPEGSYSMVAAGALRSAAIDLLGNVDGWGNRYNRDYEGDFGFIAAGYHHICAISANDGMVKCWGSDTDGQISPPADTAFEQMDSGYRHNCGVTTDGDLACWGNDGEGQASPPDGSYLMVTAGKKHSCALDTAGEIVCWGNDKYDQIQAPSGTFTHLSSGHWHNCAVDSSGAVQCWGSNKNGELEAPSGTFTEVAAGGYHSCAINGTSVVTCWGQADYGQTEAP